MEWNEILTILFKDILIPVLTLIVVPFVVNFLKTKSNEIQTKVDNETADKYIQMITETVVNCVITTNQTYVDALKEKGEFNAEAQKEAFQKTLDAVLAILSVDAKNYINEAFGDATVFLTNLIETAVNQNK